MSEQYICKVPEFIAVIKDNKGFWVSVVAASITFLAVLIALFQERIKEFFRTAKFDVKINLSPPDCHQIALTNATGAHACNSIYIRFRVQHLKGNSAENVEIMLTNFWKIDNDGNREVVHEFLPMNLIWSHFQPRRVDVRIPRKLFRHCDFGYFAPINDDGSVVLKLDTMVQPNAVAGGGVPNIILPGKYEFEITLSGDNARPMVKRWLLEFGENWSEDESEMLESIKIDEQSIINHSLFSRLMSGRLRVR